MPSNVPTRSRQRGFTLVELIMVIVIMGIIAGMVSVFMKSPIDAYIASGRRAALTDVADTVVRRMARDIQRALPNSIRNVSNTTSQCIEFMPTKTGGRYRAAPPGDTLDFTSASGDTSFEVFGDMGTAAIAPDQRVVPQDIVAVYNLGINGSDAYSGVNLALVKTSTPGAVTSTFTITDNLTDVTSTTGKQFPLASGSNRFHIIPGSEKIVSFVCPTATPGDLVRYANYTPHAASVSATSACPSSGGSILAKNVTCTLTYSGPDLQRNALVSMVLTIKDSSGETVSLQHEVHVSNTP